MYRLSENKKQSVLGGAMVLSIGVIVVTILGLVYKMSMTAFIGAVGRGYFNSAYELYTPIYALSMAGLPTAVARLVAEYVALKRYRDARLLFSVSRKMFIYIGIAGTMILALLAYPYSYLVADPRNFSAVIAIAPSLFFCCIMSVYRGYYEGLRNMKPTAVSQIIEAVVKLIAGLGIAYIIMTSGLSQFNASGTVFGKTAANLADAYSILYPLCAAGAVCGVTIGSILASLYLITVFKRKGDGVSLADLDSSSALLDKRSHAKRLIKTAIPMAAGALILNITNLIDTVTIQARLKSAIIKDPMLIKSMYIDALKSANIVDGDIAKYLWGIYGAALDFKSLVPMIVLTLGVSALPAMSAAWATNDKDAAKSTVETVLRATMLFSLPAGIGIAVLATPILTLIYGRGGSADLVDIAAPLVAVYGYATALISVSSPIINMLQGIGRADIPLKSLAIGACAKILCNFILVGTPKYNIQGAPFGSIVCYLIIVGINLICLLRITKVRLNILSVFVKPLIASVFCGISAKISYILSFKLLMSINSISKMICTFASTLISISIAVIVFAILILVLKGISEEDILSLPKGKKIAKMLDKYGLLG